MRAIYQTFTATRFQRAPQLEPGLTKERFAVIEPPSQDVFSGLFSPAGVKPASVRTVWFPAPAEREPRRLVLHFIGGALVLGWDIDTEGRRPAYIMTRHLKATHTLVGQCRLLRPLKISLSSGTRQGGNLVLALLRYLESSQTQFPLPGGATLWSPWIRVTADAGQEYCNILDSKKDLLDGILLDWGANAYLPEGCLLREAEPYISPLHHPFRTETPKFIQAAANEAFHNSIKSFAD
ncbi:hypothetical protein F4818DRAFT_456094 [Hypoxylon cercidicola]|nr:hypothetical protein F4818DRAFT_456094 [Hypoxylon cercidicola]